MTEAIPRPVVGPRRVQDVVSLRRLRVGASKNALQRLDPAFSVGDDVTLRR